MSVKLEDLGASPVDPEDIDFGVEFSSDENLMEKAENEMLLRIERIELAMRTKLSIAIALMPSDFELVRGEAVSCAEEEVIDATHLIKTGEEAVCDRAEKVYTIAEIKHMDNTIEKFRGFAQNLQLAELKKAWDNQQKRFPECERCTLPDLTTKFLDQCKVIFWNVMALDQWMITCEEQRLGDFWKAWCGVWRGKKLGGTVINLDYVLSTVGKQEEQNGYHIRRKLKFMAVIYDDLAEIQNRNRSLSESQLKDQAQALITNVCERIPWTVLSKERKRRLCMDMFANILDVLDAAVYSECHSWDRVDKLLDDLDHNTQDESYEKIVKCVKGSILLRRKLSRFRKKIKIKKKPGNAMKG